MTDHLLNSNKSISLTAQVSHITQQILDHQPNNDQQENNIFRDIPLARIYTNRRLSQKLCCWRTI